jgi:outer membrane protein assembly factor BamA
MKTLLLLVVSASLFAGTGMVRTVEFHRFEGVSVKEIVQRLHDRDIELVERPYDAQYVATAQQIVEELLAEKGRKGAQVKATITGLRGGAIKVTFTAVK